MEGSHADNNVDIQEFMIYPSGLSSFSEALQSGCEIFNKLKTVLKKNYNTAVGDEGGLHQILDQIKRALDLISESVVQAGYKLGSEIFFTLDVAASEFTMKKENLYNLDSEKKKIDNISLISYYKSLCMNILFSPLKMD